jgi:threonine synthase
MRYISTRGQAPSTSFSGTVTAGLAADGGLYLPEEVSQIPAAELRLLEASSYQRVACYVLGHLAPDIPKATLMGICRRAFTAERFGYGVRGTKPEEIVPVIPLMGNLFLAENSNGPTQAFKDLGMALLAELMMRRLMSRDFEGTARILGATSGDTGSAAIHAFKDHGVPVFMLSPQVGMSRYQQVQMWGVDSRHVYNLAIDAGFTECQDIVKAIFGDQAFRDQYQLMAINSINWARIASQICYYVWIYLQMKRQAHSTISVSVPSGNFGNAFAAYYARTMGVPIKDIVVATNENDILDRFIRTGVYEQRPRVVTTSPSMDIETASNLERLLFMAWQDPGMVRDFYRTPFPVNPTIFSSNGLRSLAVSQEFAHETMEGLWRHCQIMIDPHTAVALSAGQQFVEAGRGVPMVIIETAQPVKFRNTIEGLLGMTPRVPRGFDLAEFEARRTFEYRLPPDVEVIKQFIRKHS